MNSNGRIFILSLIVIGAVSGLAFAFIGLLQDDGSFPTDDFNAWNACTTCVAIAGFLLAVDTIVSATTPPEY